MSLFLTCLIRAKLSDLRLFRRDWYCIHYAQINWKQMALAVCLVVFHHYGLHKFCNQSEDSIILCRPIINFDRVTDQKVHCELYSVPVVFHTMGTANIRVKFKLQDIYKTNHVSHYIYKHMVKADVIKNYC